MATKVYESSTIRWTLVVHPYHTSFVNTIARDMVDNVFFGDRIENAIKTVSDGSMSYETTIASAQMIHLCL